MDISKKNILILGIGNEILSDDGIGIRLVRDLASISEWKDAEFLTCSCGGLEVIEYIKEYKKVIIIDSIKTGKGKPGEIFHFMPSDFRETCNLSNLHDVNFITALGIGENLGVNIPADIHIIAVEIIENRKFSEKLSPCLESMYTGILGKTEQEIKKLLC